jgi:hypothetical protein
MSFTKFRVHLNKAPVFLVELSRRIRFKVMYHLLGRSEMRTNVWLEGISRRKSPETRWLKGEGNIELNIYELLLEAVVCMSSA